MTITSQATNTVVKTATSEAGTYIVPFLNPGSYTMQVQSPGFRAFVRTDLIVPVQGRIEIDVVLEPGQLTETVTVPGETPLLETATGFVGQVAGRDREHEYLEPGGVRAVAGRDPWR